MKVTRKTCYALLHLLHTPLFGLSLSDENSSQFVFALKDAPDDIPMAIKTRRFLKVLARQYALRVEFAPRVGMEAADALEAQESDVEGQRVNTENNADSRAQHAIVTRVSPVNGQAPPPEYRWKPGQSANPAGRKHPGASLLEWFYVMADYTQAELDGAMKGDQKSDKAAAATLWSTARSAKVNAAGNPVFLAAWTELANRLWGKAVQQHDVNVNKLSARLDLTMLDADESREFQRLLHKALNQQTPLQLEQDDVIPVEP